MWFLVSRIFNTNTLLNNFRNVTLEKAKFTDPCGNRRNFDQFFVQQRLIRWSTCVQVGSWITWFISSWEKNNRYVKAGQIYKMTLKIVLDEQSCILRENRGDFVHLLSLQLIILFTWSRSLRKQTGTHVYLLRCVQIPTMLDIREALKKSVLPKRKQDQIELSKNRKHILKKRNEQRLQDQMNAVKKSWIYSAWLLGLIRHLIDNQTTILFYLKILHFFTNTYFYNF